MREAHQFVEQIINRTALRRFAARHDGDAIGGQARDPFFGGDGMHHPDRPAFEQRGHFPLHAAEVPRLDLDDLVSAADIHPVLPDLLFDAIARFGVQTLEPGVQGALAQCAYAGNHGTQLYQ